MAGLIQDQMQPKQTPPPQQAQQPPQGEPMQEPEMQQPGMDDEPDETNPAFQAAVQLGNDALYKEGAADDINEQLVSAEDPVSAIADIAYEITSIADERTDGQVPDELLIMLATVMLNEVGDIAVASGIQLTSADIAQAMKQMILRFVGEMGHDTTELQAAMDAIPPEQFNDMDTQAPASEA